MKLIYENYRAVYADKIRSAFSEKGKQKLLEKLLQGIALYNNNRLEKALKKFKKLKEKCETRDEYAAVLLFIAKTYEDMGYPELELQTYKELLTHDQENSTAWSNMGLVYQARGDADEAIACYEKAIEYKKDNPYAYNNLAATHYRNGNYERAIPYAEQALKLKSNLYQASNTLCLCYCALGRREECRKYFKISVAGGAKAKDLKAALENVKLGNFELEDGFFD